MNEYFERVKHFMKITNPLTLFTSESKLKECQRIVNEKKMDKEYFDSKNIIDSMVHPDTGKIIPIPFRMSFFVPGNILIVAGMLRGKSLKSIILWQTINQTYNACVNYSNSSKSNPLSTNQLISSYSLALISSVASAVGFNQFILKRNFKYQNLLLKLVPFFAVSIANIFNISLMRINEIKKGITVFDENKIPIGNSIIAGKNAIKDTIISRIAIVFPILFIPPIIMDSFLKINYFKSNLKLHNPLQLSIIALCLWLALPLCIGLFPQISEIDPKKLEKEFHNFKGKLFYNKGL